MEKPLKKLQESPELGSGQVAENNEIPSEKLKMQDFLYIAYPPVLWLNGLVIGKEKSWDLFSIIFTLAVASWTAWLLVDNWGSDKKQPNSAKEEKTADLTWKVEVIFIDDYEADFSDVEQKDRKDSEYRFELAIIQAWRELGTMPEIGDWINPLARQEYSLNQGEVAGRNINPSKRTIQFEIA
jgi:hypothetical protein